MRLVKYALVATLLIIMGCGGSTALRSGKVYYEKNKDYPKVEEWFKKAIVEEPDSWEAYLYLALSQAQQQKYAEAEENFAKSIDLAPDEEKKDVAYSNQHTFFVKHYNKGITLNSVADYDEALAEFKKAVQVEPGFSKGHVNLGVTYSLLGEEDKALESFKTAVEADPEEPEGWRNLGITYRNLKEYDKARDAYEHMVALDPEDSDGMESLGEMYLMEEDYTKALESFTKVAEVRGEDAWLQFQIGSANFSLEQFEDAAVAYQKSAALAKTAGDMDLYRNGMFNLSSAYLRLEQYEGAVSTLQQLLSVEDTVEVHERLGQAYAKQGMTDKALEEYEKAEALKGE
jgi:tetratricopeptide (TPR) repeat protein